MSSCYGYLEQKWNKQMVEKIRKRVNCSVLVVKTDRFVIPRRLKQKSVRSRPSRALSISRPVRAGRKITTVRSSSNNSIRRRHGHGSFDKLRRRSRQPTAFFGGTRVIISSSPVCVPVSGMPRGSWSSESNSFLARSCSTEGGRWGLRLRPIRLRQLFHFSVT